MRAIEELRFGREFGVTAGPRPELGRGVTAPLLARGARATLPPLLRGVRAMLPPLLRGARLTCALRWAGVPWLRFMRGVAWLRLTWEELWLRLTAEP